MDFEKFCLQILDSHHSIRFASAYDQWGVRLGGGMKPGVKNLLSDHVHKELVNLSIMDWKARKEMAKWVGKTIYTLGEFEKIKRFSFYLGEDNLLLVSTEKDANTESVVKDVIRIYYEHKNSE